MKKLMITGLLLISLSKAYASGGTSVGGGGGASGGGSSMSAMAIFVPDIPLDISDF